MAQASTFRIAAASAAIGLGGGALGQCDPVKLLASDGAAADQFGYAVALEGDTLVVGAYYGDGLESDSGSVYIFERNGGGWVETAELMAPDDVGWFGCSVALSGDTALVGAYGGKDDLGKTTGAAYVFERAGGAWTLSAKIHSADGVGGDYFGIAVALDGDRALIGADSARQDRGAAYIFERTGGIWTQVAKLTAWDGAAWDSFGSAVSLGGDTAVVGARRDDDLGEDSGSAYIFERAGGGWTQAAKLTASDGEESARFGWSVSLSGGTVLVGAAPYDFYHDRIGAAYVFERGVGGWTEAAKLTADDDTGGAEFGWSVSLDGDRAVVGARWDDDQGPVSGSAYVFARTRDGWSQVRKLVAPDGRGGEQFGWSTALDGESTVVGAHGDDDLGASSGSAYVFNLACSCPADFNGDFFLDTRDLISFLNAWMAGDIRTDWDQNGAIDSQDFLAFLNDWSAGC